MPQVEPVVPSVLFGESVLPLGVVGAEDEDDEDCDDADLSVGTNEPQPLIRKTPATAPAILVKVVVFIFFLFMWGRTLLLIFNTVNIGIGWKIPFRLLIENYCNLPRINMRPVSSGIADFRGPGDHTRLDTQPSKAATLLNPPIAPARL